MESGGDHATAPLGKAEFARVLSPMLLFAFHVVYLAVWSPEPFLSRWLDGCFSFFLSLVLCNIVRARVTAAHTSGDEEAHRDAGSAAGKDDAP